jgi:hypothetical protein
MPRRPELTASSLALPCRTGSASRLISGPAASPQVSDIVFSASTTGTRLEHVGNVDGLLPWMIGIGANAVIHPDHRYLGAVAERQAVIEVKGFDPITGLEDHAVSFGRDPSRAALPADAAVADGGSDWSRHASEDSAAWRHPGHAAARPTMRP